METVPLEVLVIGPDDRLILKVGDETEQFNVDDLAQSLHDIGLEGRAIVVWGDVEFAVTKAAE